MYLKFSENYWKFMMSFHRAFIFSEAVVANECKIFPAVTVWFHYKNHVYIENHQANNSKLKWKKLIKCLSALEHSIKMINSFKLFTKIFHWYSINS